MRILLVEDNPADARLVRELLLDADAEGFELVGAKRLDEALRRLGSEHYDAVLLDLGLPDARGLEALAGVRQAAPDLPVLVLSGRRDEQLAIEAVQHGAQDYLMKGLGDGALLTRSIRYAMERKRAEHEIHHLAHHDGLTELPNRRLLIDRLQHSIARTRRAGRRLAVLFVDVDHFKSFNDTLGHAAGDHVLREVAARLTRNTRDSDTVARLSGDEFTVVASEIGRAEDAARLASKILEALQAPVLWEGRELWVSASVGVSLYPEDGETPDTLLRTADAAMYRAKQLGGGGWQFHSHDMAPDLPDRMALTGALRRALREEDGLALHYQPRMSTRTGRVSCLEVLLRWHHPQRGLLLPPAFIPLAEESGLIVGLGEWVLEHAARQARAWNARPGVEPVRVAVNLSSRELYRRDLGVVVESTLRRAGLPPGQLELEVAEASLMRDPEHAIRVLHDLRAVGVRLAIDGFGTGAGSLSRVRSFPIDALKIDRSFVQNVTLDRADAAIASAIVVMGHGLGLTVVADGVEREEQATILAKWGCDEMQGYLFCPPRPADAVAPLLDEAPRRIA